MVIAKKCSLLEFLAIQLLAGDDLPARVPLRLLDPADVDAVNAALQGGAAFSKGLTEAHLLEKNGGALVSGFEALELFGVKERLPCHRAGPLFSETGADVRKPLFRRLHVPTVAQHVDALPQKHCLLVQNNQIIMIGRQRGKHGAPAALLQTRLERFEVRSFGFLRSLAGIPVFAVAPPIGDHQGRRVLGKFHDESASVLVGERVGIGVQIRAHAHAPSSRTAQEQQHQKDRSKTGCAVVMGIHGCGFLQGLMVSGFAVLQASLPVEMSGFAALQASLPVEVSGYAVLQASLPVEMSGYAVLQASLPVEVSGYAVLQASLPVDRDVREFR